MDEFLRILLFILLSSVKFAFGPLVVYLNEKYDFTWFETNVYAILGGMLGVVVFMYFSEWLYATWLVVKKYVKDRFRPRPLFSEPTIDTDGRVRSARVLRSIALLDEAALAAVRQWEYTPTLLNGTPVAVIMTVTVTFQLR